MEVFLEDFYTLGGNDNKITVIYFQSVYDKRLVMRYKYRLKDYRNSQGKSVYIKEYTPVSENLEKKKKEQKIVEENGKKRNSAGNYVRKGSHGDSR